MKELELRTKRTVADIMTVQPMTLRAEDHLDMSEDLMSVGRVRHLPVLDGERLVGVVSLRDLLAASLTRALDFDPRDRRVFLKSVGVREAMSPRLITVHPNARLDEAASLMLRNRIGCLPVVDAAGALVGIVTETDLIRGAYLGDPSVGEPSAAGA
jgi:CBS-domain-containing membrane protein